MVIDPEVSLRIAMSQTEQEWQQIQGEKIGIIERCVEDLTGAYIALFGADRHAADTGRIQRRYGNNQRLDFLRIIGQLDQTTKDPLSIFGMLDMLDPNEEHMQVVRVVEPADGDTWQPVVNEFVPGNNPNYPPLRFVTLAPVKDDSGTAVAGMYNTMVEIRFPGESDQTGPGTPLGDAFQMTGIEISRMPDMGYYPGEINYNVQPPCLTFNKGPLFAW